MLYDGTVIRSILALVLVAIVLAAEAPGLFVESPVCAAVDGVGAVSRTARGKTTPSCCGSASCPMHAHGCGEVAACPVAGEGDGNPSATAKAPATGSTGTKLCAPSCGRENVRMIPGVPDPGTMDATY